MSDDRKGERTNILETKYKTIETSSPSSLEFFVGLAVSRVISGLGVSSDLFVISLQSQKILTSLSELALFHTFSDVPVNESSLGVHQVELGVHTVEDIGDSGGVGNHASTTRDLGQIASGNGSRGLVVDTALESGGAPVDELDGSLGLDGRDGGGDLLGDDVSTVHQTSGHVLALAGLALDKHVLLLKESGGELGNGVGLVESVLGAVDGGIGGQQKVDSGVGDQVDLELVDVNIESTLEAERGGQGGDDLGNESVKVVVGRALNTEGVSADVVDGFIVQHEGDISVLQKGVSGEDTIVGLNHASGQFRRGVNTKIQLALFSILQRQSLQQQRSKS
mmetsp:Transcript_36078/g.56472  ORF Transcript_36078/g.56472 Transcript_36078/m.56472 type:complete len:336 (+) Transcript_36078:79-1086(+)